VEDFRQGYLITYQNDLQRSFLVVEVVQKEEIIHYQVRIMQENSTAQLLTLHKKQLDDRIYFFYDITSKITLEQLLKLRRFKRNEFLWVIKSMLTALKLSGVYLLQEGSFLLSSEYIFINPVTLEVSIAYIPVKSNQDICNSLRAWLIDLIAYKASFVDASEGDYAFMLLGFLKSEDFNLVQLEKMLDGLALQKPTPPMELAAKQPEITKKLNISISPQSSKMPKNALAAIILQIFYLALAALIIRLYMYNTYSLDMSKLSGILIVIGALDFLTITKLKLLIKAEKPCDVKEKVAKKVVVNKVKGKKGDKINKNTKIEAATVIEQTAFVNPKDLETRLLIGTDKVCPILIDCNSSTPEKIYIDKPSFLFGRLKHHCDYVSVNRAVGKLHAEIVARGGMYYLKDLNSRNGTFVNGERILSNVEYILQNNDRVSFANSEYKFTVG
jgi:hypothetical protein